LIAATAVARIDQIDTKVVGRSRNLYLPGFASRLGGRAAGAPAFFLSLHFRRPTYVVDGDENSARHAFAACAFVSRTSLVTR